MGLKVLFATNGDIIDQYDDSLSRATVVEALKQIDKIQCSSNDEMYEIDITTEHKHIVYEIEYAESQRGDRWKSGQRDKFNVGYDTTNCVDRKFYIWGVIAKYQDEKNKRIHEYDGFIVHFVRVNADHNQIQIIRDHIMRDPTKRELIEDQEVKKSTKKEDFWVFSREVCETYNLQTDLQWIRDTEPNGKYQPSMTRIARMRRGEIKIEKKNELQESVH